MAALAAKVVPGVQWWRPLDLAVAQAGAVEVLHRAGMCGRHCSLMAELFALAVRGEAGRRMLPAAATRGR